jgi:hypothetical protein
MAPFLSVRRHPLVLRFTYAGDIIGVWNEVSFHRANTAAAAATPTFSLLFYERIVREILFRA